MKYAIWFCAIFSFATNASELVYTPVNPSFGGNPQNGVNLLNSAQAQNKFKGEQSTTQQTPLQQFNENLQRSILSRMASTISGGVVDRSGNLIPGTIETTDFVINISNVGGGVMQVVTTDKSTGQSTTFQVGSQTVSY
ncbi:MAG: hypothetical protein KGZ83_18925 [Sulfuricella sp.]|nr:hypothetical protein [Sulfuricella sp.]